MEEQRLRKILAATVSTAIILLVTLIFVMIFQMVLIRKGQKNVEKLNSEIEALEEQKKNMQDQIEIWQTDWKIDERARELGYIYEYTR